MLKWLFKKLGYVHHSELEFHHCNCCSTRTTWNTVVKYYDNAMLDKLKGDLIYGEGMTTSTNNGSTIVFNRLTPQKVYKRRNPRAKKKNKRRA